MMQPQTYIANFYSEHDKEGGALLAQNGLYRYADEKTQDYVRRILPRLYAMGAITQEVVAHLRDKEFSSRFFGLSYPFLRPVSEGTDDRNGYNRYWTNFIFADEYYVCSQWQLQNTQEYELRLYVWCTDLLKRMKDKTDLPVPAERLKPDPVPVPDPVPDPASSDRSTPISTPPDRTVPEPRPFPEIPNGTRVISAETGRRGVVEWVAGGRVCVLFTNGKGYFDYPDAFRSGRLQVESLPAPVVPKLGSRHAFLSGRLQVESLLASVVPKPGSRPRPERPKGAVLCCPFCGTALPPVGEGTLYCSACCRVLDIFVTEEDKLMIGMTCPDLALLRDGDISKRKE